ncbi:hypothetical protein [Prosthecobacter sp.]|uniref:hypothetical protein n=1 Tax=Prosthecobacter sp. TaxID=1965333 RepID=UPI00378352A6
MLLEEIKQRITGLSSGELKQFTAWFTEYQSDQWDKQIEQDVAAGRFDKICAEIDANFEAGLCKPL